MKFNDTAKNQLLPPWKSQRNCLASQRVGGIATSKWMLASLNSKHLPPLPTKLFIFLVARRREESGRLWHQQAGRGKCHPPPFIEVYKGKGTQIHGAFVFLLSRKLASIKKNLLETLRSQCAMHQGLLKGSDVQWRRKRIS